MAVGKSHWLDYHQKVYHNNPSFIVVNMSMSPSSLMSFSSFTHIFICSCTWLSFIGRPTSPNQTNLTWNCIFFDGNSLSCFGDLLSSTCCLFLVHPVFSWSFPCLGYLNILSQAARCRLILSMDMTLALEPTATELIRCIGFAQNRSYSGRHDGINVRHCQLGRKTLSSKVPEISICLFLSCFYEPLSWTMISFFEM